MNQASSSHTKNFYNYNGSAYSTDSMRVYSKSPSNTQYNGNRYQPCIYSTANNIQNLQSLKNQISQLQSVLTQQHRKSSFTKSKVESQANISNDRSFYTMIKEQLKQVNNMQTVSKDSSNIVGNKIQKRENFSAVKQEQEQEKHIDKTSKTVTPQGSAIKNSSILKESTNYAGNKSEKQQALKYLLYPANENTKEQNSNNKLEEQLRQELQTKLGQLEQNKQDTIQKLHQGINYVNKIEYKNQKKQVEEEYSNKIQSELQQFERKLRKLMMQQNKDKKLKRLKKSSVLLNSKLIQDSPSMVSVKQFEQL